MINMSNFMSSPRQNIISTIQDLTHEKRKDHKLPQIIKLASKIPKLQLNFSQGVVLPDISRMLTPTPRKISPILTHYGQDKPSSIEKQLINLERIIFQEEKLYKIKETLNTETKIAGLCSDY